MRHSGIKLSDLNPKMRAQLEIDSPPPAKALHPDTGRTVRQSRRKENKTEAAFHAHLKNTLPAPGWEIKSQAIGIRLANGSVYWPDFLVHGYGTNRFYETKGRNRAAGTVKIKVAASMYPNWEFWLVKAKDRTLRGWEFQRILP